MASAELVRVELGMVGLGKVGLGKVGLGKVGLGKVFDGPLVDALVYLVGLFCMDITFVPSRPFPNPTVEVCEAEEVCLERNVGNLAMARKHVLRPAIQS